MNRTRPLDWDSRFGRSSSWDIKRLGDLANFVKGRGLSKADLQGDGNRPCIHYGELFRSYGERITNVLHGTNLEGNFVYSIRNDVLMPTSDVTPNGLATASCVQSTGVILGGGILAIRVPEDILDGVFLAYSVRHQRNQVMQLVTGTTVYHLYGRDMANFIFPVPTLKEQRAIAEALSDMDDLLVALEKLIAKKQDIKQATMQQLLTGKSRLPGFNREWETKRLDDLAVVTMGQSPPSKFYNRRGEGLPLIQGNADIESHRTTDHMYTTRASKCCGAGDLLLTVRAPVGVVAIASKQACLGRGVCGLKPWDDSGFLFHALVYAEARWQTFEQGSTFTAANSEQVEQFRLYVPTEIDEQAAIATVLSDMDDEIASLKQRRDKTRTLKQGMMQQLLIGRARLAKPTQDAKVAVC